MTEIFDQRIHESTQTPCEGCLTSSAFCLRGIMRAVVSGEPALHNEAVRTLVSLMGHSGSLTGVISCSVEDCSNNDRIGAHHLVIDAQ